MPGVVISTAVRTGPSSPTVRESSQAFFVGLADRGPTDAALKVSSIEEFEDIYGGYVSYAYLHPTVETFFEEGGTQCYIARVAGSAATTGVKNITSSGSVAIALEANGPGAWSTSLKVTTTAGTAQDTFVVKLFLGTELLMSTFNCASNEIAVGKINSHPVASKYVTATVGTTTALPTPYVANSAFSEGSDDRASVAAADYVDGLDLFNDALGTGAVSCPENASSTVYEALVAHANDYNRIAILHGLSDDTQSEIITMAQNISGGLENTEHAALYYPWVYVPTQVAGINRLIPPDGYIAGKRSAAHNTAGAHVPYAGLISQAVFVNGVVADINKANGDLLDDEGVNAIRVIQNTVRIYGARSLSADTTNFRYITAQDIVNGIVTDSNRTLESVVFSTIDGRNNSFASVEAKLIAVLEAARISGALYEAFDANGRRIDFGYTVKCDSSLNPVSQLATGLIKARVGVRVSSVGDKIEVNIIKSNLTTSVV
jgi:phage tail sheath protein FI